MHIGIFQKAGPGFEGRVHTLGLDVPLKIVPAQPSSTENSPDWRVYLGHETLGPLVGAGWDRNGDVAGRFITLQLDCPTLAQPLRARLFQSAQDEGLHELVWTRPQPTEKAN